MAQSQSSPQTFTATSTFTVPSGVYQITVEAIGGGGRGGTCLSSAGFNVGGGGGGGAYAAKTIAVTPGQIYTVTVGTGATSNTIDGKDSYFKLQSGATNLVLAKGGKTVPNNTSTGALGGSASACVGDVIASGGNGADGVTGTYGGGGGASAESGNNGVSATGYLGALATCSSGNGGDGYNNQNGNGNAGSNYGGGGGGARRNQNAGSGNTRNGGNGAAGKIVISWETIQPNTLTKGPGGVTADLQLWLRSDLLDGTTTVADNTNVSTWYTQARGSNAVKPASVGAPIYRNNATYNINYNPVVDFTNNYNTPSQSFNDNDPSRQYLKGTSGYYSQETYVVMIPDVTLTSSTNSMDVFTGESLPCQEIDRTGLALGNVDSRFSNEIISSNVGLSTSYGAAHTSTSAQYSSAFILNARNNSISSPTGNELNLNGNNLSTTEANSTTFRNVNNSQFWIGRSEGYDGSLDGRIAEIITFNKRKDDTTERAKIESYLALKYGITLGTNGTSQNYVDSNGAAVWNTTSNSGYNYNIAGIGRDDASNLNQKQSTSINTNPIVTIGLGSIDLTNSANTTVFGGDRRYLVWGDNNGSMNDSGSDMTVTFGGTTNVTTSTDLPNKKWKIVETGGDVGTTKIAIATTDLANLPALAGNDAYVMIVASDAAFTTNVETVFLTTNGTKQETTYDFDGVQYFTFGVAHETVLSRSLAFDGTDDVMKVSNTNDLPANFSVMVWVKPNGQNSSSNDRTIASKYDGSTGFKIYLSTDNKVNITWSGGTIATSSVALPNSEWHNVAITYNGTNTKLYIDGVLDTNIASAAPPTNSTIFSLGAEYRSKSDIRNYFKGDIDEFRLWNKTISQTQIRFMMDQEIQLNGTKTAGSILPYTITRNDISTLNWSILEAYYSMNSFIGTHINDDSNNSNRGNVFAPGKVTVDYQTAPMPYQTTADGLWSDSTSWVNGATQALPYSVSIIDGTTPIEWNIVKISHNITTTGNKVVKGLYVNSNTLSVTNDAKIQISHYLKLDGKIDLVGKSQLVQINSSDLEVTSSGSLERDQEGQSNKYNFNYWSSPVSSINTSTINHGFTVSGVMKDGTDPNNIQNINWSSGIDGSATSPITLSNYWIFKFQNLNNSGANWAQVGQNGTLLAGQGFTLKGSNTSSSNQNYTFVGKPNNGTITSPVSANNLNLCGNPYPSAIDADDFINDNTSSITGTLYFWEQYSTNSSHVTQLYQGGYATRTLVGGTPPVSPSGISGLGSSTKTPGRYIPVGQGFFVTGSSTGGNIVFGNNQRIFIKESSSSSNSLFKAANPTTTDPYSHEFNNRNDSFSQESFMKLRLGFNSPDAHHRQILLGFMNQYATAGFDKGYDAVSMDNQPIDMYFINSNTYLNIQGDGYFNENNSYPLGIKTATAGVVSFIVDAKENFNPNQEIFIYDNVTGDYNSIRNQTFQINLPAGIVENRFSLRFKRNITLGVSQNEMANGITIAHLQTTKTISIQNTTLDSTVKSVLLFNLVGQSVMTWKIENQDQTNIQLPDTNLSTGAYIVKVITDKGEVTKKILIK
jgi:hypothetical protein